MYTAAAAPLPPLPRCTPGVPGVPMEYRGETLPKVLLCCFAVSMGYIPQTTLSATMATTANPHMVTTPSPRPTYSSLGPLSILQAAHASAPRMAIPAATAIPHMVAALSPRPTPCSRGPPTALQATLATAPCMFSPPHVLRPLRFITGSARLAAPLRFPSPQAAATPPPSSGPLAFTRGSPIRTQGMCLPP